MWRIESRQNKTKEADKSLSEPWSCTVQLWCYRVGNITSHRVLWNVHSLSVNVVCRFFPPWQCRAQRDSGLHVHSITPRYQLTVSDWYSQRRIEQIHEQSGRHEYGGLQSIPDMRGITSRGLYPITLEINRSPPWLRIIRSLDPFGTS